MCLKGSGTTVISTEKLLRNKSQFLCRGYQDLNLQKTKLVFIVTFDICSPSFTVNIKTKL